MRNRRRTRTTKAEAGATTSVATTALFLALGAAPDEIDDAWNLMKHKPACRSGALIAADAREALDAVRVEREGTPR